MKNPFSIILAIIILLLFTYQTSHWLFKYAENLRFGVQQYLLSINEESDAIFREVLGEHYVAVEASSLSYGLSPFYYTYFQAIPTWFSLSNSDDFRVCSKVKDYCTKSVSYRSVSYSSDIYFYILDRAEQNEESAYHLYCIGNINGAGKHMTYQSEDAPSDLVSINFWTKYAWYIIHGVAKAQLAQWEGNCELQKDNHRGPLSFH